jgi:hypothetical protein
MNPGKVMTPRRSIPTAMKRGGARWRSALGLLLAALVAIPVCAGENWSGRRIMDEMLRRHEQFPYTFEEQTMILLDSAGHRDTRKLRRFSRIENDGTLKYLLVFDNPAEVRGVALLAIRHASGRIDNGIYLPAFGPVLKAGSGDARGSHFLGTDFSLEDLTAELMSDFRYVRGKDREIEDVAYFVVDAFPNDREIERVTGYGRKRHFIRQDNFFVTRSDYFDRKGHFFKRQTWHDLRPVDGDMWRANMILMENHRERHKTLIKIGKRVFSRDYVPPELFTPEHLLDHLHVMNPQQLLLHSPATGAGGPRTAPGAGTQLTETPPPNGAKP